MNSLDNVKIHKLKIERNVKQNIEQNIVSNLLFINIKNVSGNIIESSFNNFFENANFDKIHSLIDINYFEEKVAFFTRYIFYFFNT